jgi:hypothetical protein
LGEIDRPGNYELAARSIKSRLTFIHWFQRLATSGAGYLYEDSQGRIGYADSTHRTNYLLQTAMLTLTQSCPWRGLKIQTRAGDVRNSLTIKYGATSSSDVSASDAVSIAEFGTLAQIITTTLHNSADATAQANFYFPACQP